MTRRDLTGYRPSTRPGAIIGYRKNGTPILLIGGGDGTGDDGQGTGGGSDSGQGGGDKTFTQADVNAMLAREADRARQQAAQDLAKDLGVTIEEAKQRIAAHQQAEDAAKTQAQRDAEAAATAKAEADRLRAEAANDRHQARLERALVAGGLDTTNDALRRAGLAALDVAQDADADAVKAAVEKLKADAPQLFATGPAKPAAPNSDPGSGPKGNQDVKPGEFGSKGAEEAARRWGTGKTA